MGLKKYRPVLLVLLLSAALFLVHRCCFLIPGFRQFSNGMHYPLIEIYGFFSLCSALIVLALVKVKQKNIDSVGFAFLLLTFIKMGAAYASFYAILGPEASVPSERINFFIVFAVFLAIETVISIQILNNKQ